MRRAQRHGVVTRGAAWRCGVAVWRCVALRRRGLALRIGGALPRAYRMRGVHALLPQRRT
jgi:hypothetical protein